MPITVDQVQNIFNNIDKGENEKFFQHVADDVCWKVMGTHPLAGTYNSKHDFLTHTFVRLNRILKKGVILKVTGIIVQNDTAAVELESYSTSVEKFIIFRACRKFYEFLRLQIHDLQTFENQRFSMFTEHSSVTVRNEIFHMHQT